MDTRKKTAVGLAAALAAMLATAASTPAAADRIGQVRGVDAEQRLLVIDDREYRVPHDVKARYAPDSQRYLPLRRLRDGQPVEYEVAAGSGSPPALARLVLLSDP